MNDLLLIVWEVTCLALLWNVFNRSVLTGRDTARDIRLALLLAGLGALLGLAAPLYGWVPTLVGCMVLGASVFAQLVTGRHWRRFVQDRRQKNRRGFHV